MSIKQNANMENEIRCRTERVAHFIFTEHHVPCTISTALMYSCQPRLVAVPNYLSCTNNMLCCHY